MDEELSVQPEPWSTSQLIDHVREDHYWSPAESDAFCTKHRLSLRGLHNHEHAHGRVNHRHPVNQEES